MGEKVFNNLHLLLAQTTPLLTAPTRWDSPSLLKKDRLCLALIQMQSECVTQVMIAKEMSSYYFKVTDQTNLQELKVLQSSVYSSNVLRQ